MATNNPGKKVAAQRRIVGLEDDDAKTTATGDDTNGSEDVGAGDTPPADGDATNDVASHGVSALDATAMDKPVITQPSPLPPAPSAPEAVPMAPEATEKPEEPELAIWEQKHYIGMPKDGMVLGPDDEDTEHLYVRGVLIGDRITLTEPVYRAVKPSKSIGLVFHMLHNKGAQIPAAGAILVK